MSKQIYLTDTQLCGHFKDSIISMEAKTQFSWDLNESTKIIWSYNHLSYTTMKTYDNNWKGINVGYDNDKKKISYKIVSITLPRMSQLTYPYLLWWLWEYVCFILFVIIKSAVWIIEN